MTEPYRLAAFDPGERTGFVVVRVGHDFDATRATGPEQFDIEGQGVLPVYRVFRDLRAIISSVQRVEYETWRLYGSHAQEMIGNDMQPSQIVGCIRYEARLQGRKIKSFGADIKKIANHTMPVWLREHMALSSEQHDQDAIMHAWFYAWHNHYKGIDHDD